MEKLSVNDKLINKYKNEMLNYYSKTKNKSTISNNEVIPAQAPVQTFVEESATQQPRNETRNLTEVEKLFEEYVKEHPKDGKLKVQTLTARRTFPIENATVEISKRFKQGKYIIGTYETDKSGLTPIITVPTASKVYSQEPGLKQPYSTFDAIVTHPDFTEIRIRNIAVFEGIVSNQVIDMIPKSAMPSDKPYIEYTSQQDLDM